jgi:hypothetical protein
MFETFWWLLRPWLQRLGIFDQPRKCIDCGIPTAEPLRCWWCDREMGVGQ